MTNGGRSVHCDTCRRIAIRRKPARGLDWFAVKTFARCLDHAADNHDDCRREYGEHGEVFVHRGFTS
ncbi:MAG: hypothetical protein H0T60_10320 [Acidobacteria bacterium]|nr:hypothetical protein [Acidobacteriota bacterium]